MQLQSDRAGFDARNVDLIAVGGDDLARTQSYVEDIGVGFPVVADGEAGQLGKVARAFGVLDEANQIPWPSVFLLAPDGTVKWSNLSPTYKIEGRLGSADLFEAIDSL